MIKTKWLIYTVLIGLLPFIIRILLYLVIKDRSLDFLMNESDFIILGLVLNLTNLNELENQSKGQWKSVMIGSSAVQIAIYAGILALSYVTELNNQLIEESTLFWCALVLSLGSFLLSFSIYDRLTKIHTSDA
jgi:hypothetical protein